MKITSENFPKLRKFNKRAGKHRHIRSGAIVNTKRGVGIVTVRDKNEVWVAHESDSIMWCESYIYDVADVDASDEHIDPTSQLYRGAWQFIEDSALSANQTYEVAKHKAIVADNVHRIGGRTEKRTISNPFSSNEYVRFTGDGFDFEINVTRPFIPDGDRVLYAIGESDGTITDMDGHGRIYRRKMTDEDVNYGLAKYAAPQPKEDE